MSYKPYEENHKLNNQEKNSVKYKQYKLLIMQQYDEKTQKFPSYTIKVKNSAYVQTIQAM